MAERESPEILIRILDRTREGPQRKRDSGRVPLIAPCQWPSGCENLASGRKPYCQEHVESHAFVQEVLERVAAMQAEIAALNAGRRPKKGGLLEQEVVAWLYELELLSRERQRRERCLAYMLQRCLALGVKRKAGVRLLADLVRRRVALVDDGDYYLT